jgi:hypothetical protein
LHLPLFLFCCPTLVAASGEKKKSCCFEQNENGERDFVGLTFSAFKVAQADYQILDTLSV